MHIRWGAQLAVDYALDTRPESLTLSGSLNIVTERNRLLQDGVRQLSIEQRLVEVVVLDEILTLSELAVEPATQATSWHFLIGNKFRQRYHAFFRVFLVYRGIALSLARRKLAEALPAGCIAHAPITR